MNFRDFPVTRLRLPEIGFGTWRYHGGVAPLRAAIERNACLIDTAEAYGTEAVVGAAIQGVRARVFVATKARPRYFRRADLLRVADESLQRLRTDYIDLYQLHWPNYAVPIAETMATMEELVARGKIRFIGVSNFSIRDLRRAQVALSTQKIASNQVRYNLTDRTVEGGLLQYCRVHGIAVIAHTPLAHGLDVLERHDRRQCLRRVAALTGKTPAQVALNWCLAHDGVIAIPKASSIAHVEEDCGASAWRLSAEHLAGLDRAIAFRRRGRVEIVLRRWARRSLQQWGYDQ